MNAPRLGLLFAALGLAAPGCARVRPTEATRAPATSAPARPPACREVQTGEPLQAAIDAAPDHAVLCLAPGVHAAPIRVTRGITLWGPRAAIVRSSGEGSTVSLEGAGVALLGLTVDGSGRRFDLTDAGVRVRSAEDARVEGVRIVNATFGVLVERARRVVVRGNEVIGGGQESLGLRGDGIRLWETQDSLVDANDVRASRDVVVWYSPRNRVQNNRVEGSRYGTHLMYSDGTSVAHNRYLGDEVGVFVMYSRNVDVTGNLVADAGAASGMGLGLKESGNVRVRANLFLHDTLGAYVDGSPLQPTDVDDFERNVFRLDDTAVAFHGPPRATRFRECSFRDNAAQVRVDGGGDALGVAWDRNDWDDYQGYDLDGDGIGDVPYELRSLSTEITDANPELSFFRGAPTLALVEAAGHALPLFEPRTIVHDPRPRITPLALEGLDAD